MSKPNLSLNLDDVNQPVDQKEDQRPVDIIIVDLNNREIKQKVSSE